MTKVPELDKLQAALTRLGTKVILDTEMRYFRDPDLAAALAYWQSLAGNGPPSRRDFSPKQMRPFLQKVSLFEAIKQPDGEYRLKARLTGREFCKAFVDMSGKYIDECVPAQFYKRWLLVWQVAAYSRRPLRGLSVPAAFGRVNAVVEWLIAPLLDDAGHRTLIFFVCNYEADCPWKIIQASEAHYQHPGHYVHAPHVFTGAS